MEGRRGYALTSITSKQRQLSRQEAEASRYLCLHTRVEHTFGMAVQKGQGRTKALCWLLAVSVRQMRPLRTTSHVSRTLPILKMSGSMRDAFTCSSSQRGNVHY